MVSTVLWLDEATNRTHTAWPLVIVPAAVTKVAVQPIEYSPPEMLMGTAVLIPDIVTVLDVRTELNGTAPCEMNDIASGVVFLTSELSSYVTGHTLVIDGGVVVKDLFAVGL